MARAAKAFDALPAETRDYVYALIRAASDAPLTDDEVRHLTLLLWAQRGEGLIASLESGYRLFETAPDERSDTGAPVRSLTPEQRRELLASLLAQRSARSVSDVADDSASRAKNAPG